MPIYKLDTTFVDQDGKEIPFDVGSAPATLKQILMKMLLSDYNPGNPLQPITGADKMARYELYLRVKAEKEEIQLSVEEATLLKGLAGFYTTIICGQLGRLLDGK